MEQGSVILPQWYYYNDINVFVFHITKFLFQNNVL